MCGNGFKTPGEGCDDGNTALKDGCSNECAVEFGFVCSGSAPQLCDTVCGDGIHGSRRKRREPTEAPAHHVLKTPAYKQGLGDDVCTACVNGLYTFSAASCYMCEKNPVDPSARTSDPPPSAGDDNEGNNSSVVINPIARGQGGGVHSNSVGCRY